MERAKGHARPITHTHARVVGQAGPGGVEEHGIGREAEVLISDWTRLELFLKTNDAVSSLCTLCDLSEALFSLFVNEDNKIISFIR